MSSFFHTRASQWLKPSEAVSTSTKWSCSLTVFRQGRTIQLLVDVKIVFADETGSIGRLLAVNIFERTDFESRIVLEVRFTSNTNILVESLTV